MVARERRLVGLAGQGLAPAIDRMVIDAAQFDSSSDEAFIKNMPNSGRPPRRRTCDRRHGRPPLTPVDPQRRKQIQGRKDRSRLQRFRKGRELQIAVGEAQRRRTRHLALVQITIRKVTGSQKEQNAAKSKSESGLELTNLVIDAEEFTFETASSNTTA